MAMFACCGDVCLGGVGVAAALVAAPGVDVELPLPPDALNPPGAAGGDAVPEGGVEAGGVETGALRPVEGLLVAGAGFAVCDGGVRSEVLTGL